MRFRKIRMHQDGRVELAWEDQNGQDTQTTILVSRDAPRPEFTEAMQNLQGDFLHVLGIPAKPVQDRLEMTGLSATESKNGVRSFVLTGKLKTPGGGVVGLSSPRVTEPGEGEEADGDARLTDAQLERVQEVLDHAARYASGDRIQRQLALEEEETSEEQPAGAGA